VAKLISSLRLQGLVQGLGISLAALLLAIPVQAHHMLGGKLPANFLEGFLSGLGHPVIGLDHFAFMVAAGLLATTKRNGIWIPIAVVLAALAGTGMHLLRLDLPGTEGFVALSVLLFGLLLALPNHLNLAWMVGLSAIAGIFHGYAYGESIVGAEMSPLIAYLLGFTTIQLAIALSAFTLGQWALQRLTPTTGLPLRFAGFTLCGVGMAFLVTRLGL
jgi:urease accessory protein